jgi:uncharacterized protein (TIGR03435 family)
MQRSGVLVGLTSLLVFAPGCGQAPAKLEFDGASMRIATPSDNRVEQRSAHGGGPGTPDAERATWSRVALNSIVAEAFDVPERRVSGPEWMKDMRYDIAAYLPAGASAEQSRQMLRSLLVERLYLAAHFETTTEEGYELVVAASGAKLKLAPDPNAPRSALRPVLATTHDQGFPELRGVFGNTSMEELAKFLGERLGTVEVRGDTHFWKLPAAVADKTGLTERYDFTLDFAGFPSSEAFTAINDALQNQLGLKLIGVKVPATMLVIDHAEGTPAIN